MSVASQGHGDIVRLAHGEASAEVAVYGSTVISWYPKASKDKSAIFLSRDTKPGKPFRGGIPLVFPVFGEPKDHKDLPELLKGCTRHGFCRDRLWKVQTRETSSVSMVLSSEDEPALLEKFPFAFTLIHTVTLSDDALHCNLHLSHLSSSQHTEMPFHALFHNYIATPSASSRASGLKGVGYIDKVAGGKRVTDNTSTDQGWNQEIDRVYQGGAPDVTIEANDGTGVQLTLERSKTIPDTTLWNPGHAADESMGDLHKGGWKEFVCAEPGHVDKFETLARGKEWTGTQKWTFRKSNDSQPNKQVGSTSASKAVEGAAGGAGAAAAGIGTAAVASSHKKEDGSKETSKSDAPKLKESKADGSHEKPSDATSPLHKTISEHYAQNDNKCEKDADDAAARLIQRNYRSYVSKREKDGMTLSPDARWGDAMGHMKLETATNAARSGNKNDANSRWRRGGVLVGQLAGSPGVQPGGGGQSAKMVGGVEGGPSLKLSEELKETMPQNSSRQAESKEEQDEQTENDGKVGDVPGGNVDGKVDNIRSIAKKNEHGLKLIERWTRGAPAQELSKVMEAQYWLEMVDRKHRYGSNLKHYHAAWEKDASTKDNFFKWLDEGAGKELDLQECPRERLESEQITYLSQEKRANYVVDVKDGLLYWRRNGKPVDTTKNRWRDLGNGRGIVELGPEERQELQRQREERAARRGKKVKSGDESSSSSDSSSDEEDDEDEQQESKKAAAKHYGGDQGKSLHKKVTTTGLWDRILRKTVSNNTWIYVFNSRYELFVGLKKTGEFQHSSFLYGGRVLSAGLLRAKDGYLTSLSPLSGHYRAGTAHFRYFVASLQDSGVNLEHVALSKSLLMLRGLEVYGKMNKKLKGGFKHSHDKEKDGKQKDQGSGAQNASQNTSAAKTTPSKLGDASAMRAEKQAPTAATQGESAAAA